MPSDTPPDRTGATASAKREARGEVELGAGTSANGRDTGARAAPYRPTNVLDALRSAAQPGALSRWLQGAGSGRKGQRARAQPASGTAEDARAVNYVDKRERLIATFLSAFQAVLGVLVFVRYRSYVVQPHKTKPVLSVSKAHLETLNYHHSAPEVLIINLILAAGIAVGVISKRRALIGFTVLLGGLGMTAAGGGDIGLIYLGIGLWLVFRAMKRTSSARNARAAAATAGASNGRAPRARPASTGRRGRPAAGARGASATSGKERKAPAASKRYTPPKPAGANKRKAAAAASRKGENEKEPSGFLGRLRRRPA